MTNQTTKPYNPTSSLEEYQRKYPNARVILELEEKQKCLPASKWGKEHLIAYRLIQQTGGKILSILKEFAPKRNDLKNHNAWAHIKRLVDGPQKGHLEKKSRLELVQENNNLGTLWSTLAQCMLPRNPVQPRPLSTRKRQQTQRKDYVSSVNIEPSSSGREESALDQDVKSSWQQSSLVSSEVSDCTGFSYDGEVDEDEHNDRTESEVLTVNLAGAFIGYVLNYCSEQNPSNGILLEFREDPLRAQSSRPSEVLGGEAEAGSRG